MDAASAGNPLLRAARRGALWTSPLWAVILLYSLVIAFPGLEVIIDPWAGALSSVLLALLFFGSSLCLLPGFAMSAQAQGLPEASKKGSASALAVAASYFLFAVFAFFLGRDEKTPAWGGAFGLLSVSGSLVAAVMGSWFRLGWDYLARTVLNPYRKSPPGS